MKYLSQEKFDRLQKLIEAVIAAHAQARETQENKNCVSAHLQPPSGAKKYPPMIKLFFHSH